MRIRNFLVVLLITLSVPAFAGRLRQVALIDLPGQPGFDALAIANGSLIVAHTGADTVEIFDLTKRRIVAQVRHVNGASGIAVDEKNGRVFLSSPDAHRVVVISSSNWDVQAVIPVQANVEHILYAPTNDRLYLANSLDRSIGFVDLSHNNEVHKADAGGTPERLAFDTSKNQIYVTLQDKRAVAAFDTDLKPVAQWNLKASQPTGLALDGEARRLYVAVRSAILTLDADSGAELSRVAAPAGVDALSYDRQSGTLFAAANGAIGIFKVRPGGLTRDTELNIDVRGSSLAYDPATNLIYLPGGREGRSKLLIMKPMSGDIPAVVEKDKHSRGAAEGQ